MDRIDLLGRRAMSFRPHEAGLVGARFAIEGRT